MATATGSMDSMSMSSTIGSAGQVCKVQMLWNWNTIGACFITPQWQIANRGSMIGTCFGVVFLVMVLEALRRTTKEFDRWIVRGHRRAAEARSQQAPPAAPPGNTAAAAPGQNPAAAPDPAPGAAGEQAGVQPAKSATEATVADVGAGGGDAAAAAAAAAPGSKEGNPGQQAHGAAPGGDGAVTSTCPLYPLILCLGRLGALFRPPAVVPGGDGGVPRPCRPTLWQQGLRALLHTAQFTVAYFIMLLAMHYNGYIIISIIVGAYLGSLLFSWERLSGVDGSNTSAAGEATVCCA